MEGCYYIGYQGWAFGWTQMIPAIVGLVCTVLTTATHQPLYFVFSLFLYVPQIVLWNFQAYFQVDMPDPVCQTYHSWAFPSIPAFYVGICVAIFFTISLLWKKFHSWIVWLAFYLLGLFPPLLLIWFGYNRWWEALFSFGLGAGMGVAFGFAFRYYVTPVMPYLQHHFPLKHFGYRDTICMNDDQLAECIAVHEALLKFSRLQ